MSNKFKWIGFGIGVIVLAILTGLEICIRKFNRYIERGVAKLDPRSLEEQIQSYIDVVCKYRKENFTGKV